MKYILPAFLMQLLSLSLFAQNATVSGIVKDVDNGDPVSFMSVYVEGTSISTTTDVNGKYSISIPPGTIKISFSSIDYNKSSFDLTLSPGEKKTLDVQAKTNITEIGMVVKTESKYEKPIENVTVTIEVLKPQLIENKNIVSADAALQQVPGVTIVDSEPQIRAGSGYSFGAGSRVMVLVDDMPLLSGDAGRPSWGYIPIENLEQIEVIKGASSVLYGSSALNGVINIRTAFPKDKPLTRITTFTGIYNLPDSANWTRNNPPVQGGMNFLHSRKIKQLDLVLGGNIFGERGFVGPALGDTTGSSGNFSHRVRFNFNTRYRFKKVPGLFVGLNGNALYGQSAANFVWNDAQTGIFRAFPGTVTTTLQTTFNIDPYIGYFGSKGSSYNLRLRYYYLDNNNDNNQGNSSQVLFGEFQYQKRFISEKARNISFLRNFVISAGAMVSQVFANADLFLGDSSGGNTQTNVAAYLQVENRFWNRLTVTLGVRYEFYKLRDLIGARPVFRGGLNLQVAKYTFIRASFGQGYRFPTIAERYIQTMVGPASIFPNPDLRDETSYSAELGIKQAFRLGKTFKGYLDVAGYYQHYNDYIEFTASFFGGTSISGFGFKSVNTGRARVYGVDISLAGTGQFTKDFGMNILAGYNYSMPQTLDPNYVYTYDSINFPVSYYNTSSLVQVDGDTNATILKYRFRHTAKLDVEFIYKWFNLGVSFRYNSYMENVDYAFYFLDQVTGVLKAGLPEYRATHNSGDYVFDARFGAKVHKNVKVSLIVNNIANRIYSLRPLYVEAPRTFILQCAVEF